MDAINAAALALPHRLHHCRDWVSKFSMIYETLKSHWALIISLLAYLSKPLYILNLSSIVLSIDIYPFHMSYVAVYVINIHFKPPVSRRHHVDSICCPMFCLINLILCHRGHGRGKKTTWEIHRKSCCQRWRWENLLLDFLLVLRSSGSSSEIPWIYAHIIYLFYQNIPCCQVDKIKTRKSLQSPF